MLIPRRSLLAMGLAALPCAQWRGVLAAAPKAPGGCAASFLRLEGGHFVVDGARVALKGVDYFGSWRRPSTVEANSGVEHFTIWSFYHDWDIAGIEADFRFLRAQLSATCVRIGTPAQEGFRPLVEQHGYEPWFAPDGSVTDLYRSRLIDVADAAYRNGLRVHFCLLWNLANEIAANPKAFRQGGEMDVFYARQVQSVAASLRDHPGVISYSIGNEVLVRWKINGEHPSRYEPVAAGFMLRRLREVRAAAPLQLLALDEDAAPDREKWFFPGMHFMPMEDVDGSNGGVPFRMVDKVDFLSSHYYPIRFTEADSGDARDGRIEDAVSRLGVYLDAAARAGKPVILGEFGLQVIPGTIPPSAYAGFRDALFEQVLARAPAMGLQGLLAWGALPEITMRPGRYSIRPMQADRSPRVEVDVSEDDGRAERIQMIQPSFDLFTWQATGDAPVATAAARALAAAWPGLSQMPAGSCGK